MPPASKTTAASSARASKPKTAPSSGTATPVSSVAEKDTSPEVAIATLAGGRPDKKLYEAEQERLKKEIDALQLKLVCSSDTSVFLSSPFAL